MTGNTEFLAQDAKALLDNPAFRKVFSDVREGIIKLIENLDLTQDKERERLCLSLQILRNIQAQLGSYMSDLQVNNIKPEEF